MAVSITFVIVWDMAWSCLVAKYCHKHGSRAFMGNAVGNEGEGGEHISEICILISTRELKLTASFACT